MPRPSVRADEMMRADERMIAHAVNASKREEDAMRGLRAAENELEHAAIDVENAEREVAACHAVHVMEARESVARNRHASRRSV